MFNKEFLQAAGERAIFTFSEVLVALAVVTTPIELVRMDWGTILITAFISAVVSFAKSIVVAGATDGSPSISKAEKLSKGRHSL